MNSHFTHVTHLQWNMCELDKIDLDDQHMDQGDLKMVFDS
jgi:hypothetical protein